MSYHPVRGLGDLQYNTGRGVFRPGGRGGGIFDGNIAGLGDLTSWLVNPAGSALTALLSPSDSSASDGAAAADAAAAAAAGQQAGQSAGAAAAQQVSSGGSGQYPWGVYSDATLALQKSTNVALKQYGYCPISEDGKLGRGTCGARLALKSVIPGMSNPDTCQGYTTPSKCGSGGGGSVAPSSSLTPAQQAALTAQYSGGSDWTKYLVFAGGAAAVLGIAYYMEKKRRK